jgi:hypothetical protein
VFGCGEGNLPSMPEYTLFKSGNTDMDVSITATNAVGYNILWGHSPEKLYHNYLTFNTLQRIGALIKGQSCYVRVDAFNENGITKGRIQKL